MRHKQHDTRTSRVSNLSRLPIFLILVVQAALSLTLYNFAFQDEALYIHTGRWMIDSWNGQFAFDLYPESYFSGAPNLYPVLAGWLDDLGGLGLVRAASTVFMLLATVFVYKAIQQVFLDHKDVQRIAVFGTASFAFCSSVLFVGHFATFDAPSYCALTLGFWLTTRAVRNPSAPQWAVGAGAALVTAIFFKYASIVAVPFVIAVAVLGASTAWKQRLIAAASVVATMVLLLVVSVLTWADKLWSGFLTTTADRNPIAPSSPFELLGKLSEWAWVPALVAVVGFAVLVSKRKLLALGLLAGAVTCVGLQVLSGEDVSLQKHVVLSLIFAAPLCGVVLARMSRVRPGQVVVAIVIAAMLGQGFTQSVKLFDNWPDAEPLASAIAPSIPRDPNFHILGENPESYMYALYDETFPRQWVTAYEGSFKYKNLEGFNAYKAALDDGYFQMVVLDGSSEMGKRIQSELSNAGYAQSQQVTETRTYRTWTVYTHS